MDFILNEDALSHYNQDIFAKAAASTFFDFIFNSEDKDLDRNICEIKIAINEKYPHNLVVKNSIDYLTYRLDHTKTKAQLKERYYELLSKLENANTEVSQIAAKKIQKASKVFVHSLNNQIILVLLEAAKNKKFSVNLVEHSPFSYGKHLQQKLMKMNIDSKLFPDLLIGDAAAESDCCLIGAELISEKGAIVKAGTRHSAKISKENNIPVYVCGHSLKFDTKNHMATMAHKQHKQEEKMHDVKRIFEMLPAEDIYAFITEHGVLKPQHLKDEVRLHNSWMFVY